MARKSRNNTITITGNGRYPLVPLSSIQIAERPEVGQESSKLFFNPRNLDSFTPERMKALMSSIQADGLQQPPIVRVYTYDGKKSGEIKSVELVAGERRLRSLLQLYKANPECYDDQSGEMVPAKQLYEFVPCKVFYNIEDEHALRLAFLENNEHQSLSTKEEIELVERLRARGLVQEQIVKILNTNITWVSQTSNFRTELPSEAFEKLLAGKLARNVACQLLSFKPEDREAAYSTAVKVEEEERTAELEGLQSQQEIAEDDEDLAAHAKRKAVSHGNLKEAKSQEKRQVTASKKLAAVKSQKTAIEAKAGVIRQGHIEKGAYKAKVAPKKGSILSPAMLHECYIETTRDWLEEGRRDSVTNEFIPPEGVEVLRATAKAILSGETDPEKVIRYVMFKRGEWANPDGEANEANEEDLEPSAAE